MSYDPCMRLSALVLALPLLLASCPPSCQPEAGKVSWDGRSPVGYVTIPITDGASTQRAQDALDAGLVVEIGQPGKRQVAGHRSSHGGVFSSGPGLEVGDWVQFDGETFHVTGRDSSVPGAWPPLQPGLTVQYSGCGGVCLVRAQPG